MYIILNSWDKQALKSSKTKLLEIVHQACSCKIEKQSLADPVSAWFLSQWKFLQFSFHFFQGLGLGWGWNVEQQVVLNSDKSKPFCHVLMILLQVWKVFPFLLFITLAQAQIGLFLLQPHGRFFYFSFEIWLIYPPSPSPLISLVKISLEYYLTNFLSRGLYFLASLCRWCQLP